MEPQNPDNNTNPNPATPSAPPAPDLATPTAPDLGTAPISQQAPQPTTSNSLPSIYPTPTAPQQSIGANPTAAPDPTQTPNPAFGTPPAVTGPVQNSFSPVQPPMPDVPGPSFPPAQEQPTLVNPMAFPSMSASEQTAKRAKKYKLIGISIITAAILLLGVAGYFAYSALSGLKLTKYTGEGYSLLVPADFKQEENSDITTFQEDEDESTASAIVTIGDSFPNEPTDEELDTAINLFKVSLESGLEEYTGRGEITNLSVTDTTHKGHKAIRATADAEEDGKHLGKITVIWAFTKKGYYGLIILAHQEDADFAKKVDKIIDSFEVE